MTSQKSSSDYRQRLAIAGDLSLDLHRYWSSKPDCRRPTRLPFKTSQTHRATLPTHQSRRPKHVVTHHCRSKHSNHRYRTAQLPTKVSFSLSLCVFALSITFYLFSLFPFSILSFYGCFEVRRWWVILLNVRLLLCSWVILFFPLIKYWQ